MARAHDPLISPFGQNFPYFDQSPEWIDFVVRNDLHSIWIIKVLLFISFFGEEKVQIVSKSCFSLVLRYYVLWNKVGNYWKSKRFSALLVSLLTEYCQSLPRWYFDLFLASCPYVWESCWGKALIFVFLPCLFVCVLLSCCVLQKALALNASDTHISFLPLAHMYEQIMMVSLMCTLSSLI